MYPLQTQKWADFELFRRAAVLMQRGTHLTQSGLRMLMNLKRSSNWGISKDVKAILTSPLAPVVRPEHNMILPMIPFWISGFTTGDGSFIISIVESVGKAVRIRCKFNLTQHIRDHALMLNIRDFFGLGQVLQNRNTYYMDASSLKDISKIREFYKKYPVGGLKYHDFELWLEVHELMKMKAHLTPEGVRKIKAIKAKQRQYIE